MCLPIRLPWTVITNARVSIFVYKISTARRAVYTCVYIQISFVHNDRTPIFLIVDHISIYRIRMLSTSVYSSYGLNEYKTM